MNVLARSMLRVAAAAALVAAATPALAQSQRYVDPPSRVARLAHVEGRVSVSPAGTRDWRRAHRNRPHWRGDRFWTDRRSRAELQLGGASLRLDERTGVEILDLDDRYAQFELSEGTVNLSVRHLDRGDTYEIATPMFALVVDRRAVVRVDVEPRSGRTEVVVWDGSAVAYGQRGQFALRDGDAVRFYDPSLRDYDFFRPRPDGFDAYADARDARLERSRSLRYVPAGLIGYAELDDHGSWSTVGDYGAVWFPSRVGAGWRPYRDGHWIYQEPWGWTWVDDAEWGFATSHYGRWAQIDRRWGWIPSPRRERPVYAPALVAFLGGGFDSRSGPIGWFPLGPRELYVPTYRTSRDYFSRVNFGNTVFTDRRYVSDAYGAWDRGQRVPNLSYRYNRGEYVTAVPRDVFLGGRSVSRASVPYRGDSGAIAQLDRIRALQPSPESRYGAAAPAEITPTGEVFDRDVFARHAPPPGVAEGGGRARGERGRGDARDNVRMIQGDALPVIPRDDPRTEGGVAPSEPGVAERPRGPRERGERRGPDERELERAVGEREREAERAQREVEAEAARGERPGRGRGRDDGAGDAAREAAERQRELDRQAREQQQAQAEAERAQREQQQQRGEQERAARAQEQAQREAQREAERQAREQQQAQREAEQSARELEQARREAQREAERQGREQEQAQREAERAAREQEQAARAAERAVREQEQAQREAQRELEQQARAQEQAQREAQREAERQMREQEQAQRQQEQAQREAQQAAEQQMREQEQAQREAQRAAEEQMREQERAQREAEQAARQQQQEQEQAQREAERAAREAEKEAEKEERRRAKEEGEGDSIPRAA